MPALEYPRLEETLHHERLDNGLDVFVLPKPGFTKTFAVLATRFGSADNRFRLADGREFAVPDGLAHFLEHKMFEEPDGDVFARFAANGASANAYTGFDQTVYLFSATRNVDRCLDILLDFVQSPYFTDANVEKEKGIIIQEIHMYRDNPDWRVYFGLLEALYHRHPVRIDIAGTPESVSSITKELLYECHRMFYHPSNMHLFVVGGVDPERTLETVRANQARKRFDPPAVFERVPADEPENAKEPMRQATLAVAMPKCYVGFKETDVALVGERAIRRDLAARIVLDALFSRSSPVYQDMYDEHLVFDSFGAQFTSGPGYAFSVIGGDTRDPGEMARRVTEAMERTAERGLDADVFERIRRKKIGAHLRLWNSPEAVAGEFVRFRHRGGDLFRVVELYESLTLEEANGWLRAHVHPSRRAVSVVRGDAS